MYDEELYKKSWNDPLLSCVSQEDIPKILVETTHSHAIGETPFNLVYDSEAVLPAEAGLPTYRQKYKHLMARTYNWRVKNKQFKIGDLVLRLYSITHPKDKDKLSPKWEGLYRINRMIGPRTYELEKLNGDVIPRTWHASNLTKYYV
ncbi:hypothetical protein LIER_06215 [Lithospermum erythrorhizon]|uniref:Uncharacterized protein n=1 Tax=Lithospermum erythrorhizon TaxID=34254 RepID=A0AAV3P3P8_LITER